MSGASSLGERLVAAIGARDFDAIRDCLAPDVRFRALIPDRLREHDNAEDAVERLRLWWGGADEFDLVDARVDEVVDRLHLAYRIRCREQGERYVVEQHAYADVRGGRVADLSILCSGFRPVAS